MGVEGIRENIGRWLGVWRGREEVRVGDEERGGEKREEKEIFLIVLSSDFSNNLKRNAFK